MKKNHLKIYSIYKQHVNKWKYVKCNNFHGKLIYLLLCPGGLSDWIKHWQVSHDAYFYFTELKTVVDNSIDE